MRLLLATACLIIGGGAARAELVVCNDSGVSRSLAIGHGDGAQWTSEGWWVIAPGDCKVVMPGPLKGRYVYWRATAPGEDFPDEGYMFCTTPEPFTITGSEDCAARGYQAEGFKVADTGTTETDHTLVLTEANAAPQAAEASPGPGPDPAPDAPGAFLGPIPTSGPGFTPGQAGEPFAQSALMQGCGPSEAGEACLLYAEGWRYLLRQGGVTPPEIYATLSGLAPNTPVQITGEIVSQGDVTAEVNLSRIEPGPADPYAAQRAALQGAWVSADDPQALMMILGSEMTDVYGTETLAESIVTLGDSCADGTGAGGTVLTVADPSRSDDPPLCLALDSVTEDRLTLINLPRGNLLTYRREMGGE